MTLTAPVVGLRLPPSTADGWRWTITAALLLAVAFAVRPLSAADLTVAISSSRPGHLFTDSEAVDVRVAVAGAAGAATVAYTVRESAGPWSDTGSLPIVTEAAQPPVPRKLPLQLPGRGLYHLTVTATAGAATTSAETWVAVVFTPPTPTPGSPWGIFYTPPSWFAKDDPEGAQKAALQHRLLGASWSRVNFWAHSFGTVTAVPGGKPQVDLALWKTYTRALRHEGISIFGEISQCPKELSSRADETEVKGDSGPVFNRVKPADYAQWDALIENLSSEFRDDIGVWEIWNEVNLPDQYWVGSVDEFMELVEHTSAAFRRGNPKARIAAAGFVNGQAYLEALLAKGFGKRIDILSVHYTDEAPAAIADYRRILDKNQLSIPIWNSEERSEVPLRNLAAGIQTSFKFLHVDIGYADYRPLVRKDWTLYPSAILFSVGAHCIGTGVFSGMVDGLAGKSAYRFMRQGESIVAIDSASGGARLFGPEATSATFAIEPLVEPAPAAGSADAGPRLTDGYGRSTPLRLEKGRVTVTLPQQLCFINGCKRIDVVPTAAPVAADAIAFEAESGRFSPGWQLTDQPGFSAGKVVEIWAGAATNADGHWAEVTMHVAKAGTYELVFSGNSLARLKPPRSISPFSWRIDGGAETVAADALPVEKDVPGCPEGLGVLGTVALTAGDHVFRMTLTGPRDTPDTKYAMWFDAVGLRAPAAKQAK